VNAAQATDIDFKKFEWPTQGVTRAPYRLFTDPEIYQQEQQRIFRGRVWSFLGLEIEIPQSGRRQDDDGGRNACDRYTRSGR
jgi:anthranilate 1,2-dioxygenase large subunit